MAISRVWSLLVRTKYVALNYSNFKIYLYFKKKIENYEKSKEYGMKSLECAEKIDEDLWKLNATVLIAQSEVKMGDYENVKKSLDHFKKALEMTEKQSIILSILNILFTHIDSF